MILGGLGYEIDLFGHGWVRERERLGDGLEGRRGRGRVWEVDRKVIPMGETECGA